MPVDDTDLGTYVYCASHVGPHTSGWCTVPKTQKLGLLAETAEEAEAEVRHLGLPWYGHCPVCYVWRGNSIQSICPDHTAAEYAGAALRRDDLSRHLFERSMHALDNPETVV